MKLSGWQRIGIVLSVLWVFLVCSAATYDYKINQGFDRGFGFADPVPPVEYTGKILLELPVSAAPIPFTGELDPVKKELNISRVLAVSMVPVFLAWLLFYVVYFVGRWVRNGFRGQ